MNPQPDTVPPAQALLDALASASAALALADGEGRLLWRTARFAALFPATDLRALWGAGPLAAGRIEVAATGAEAGAWRLQLNAAPGGGWMASAEPLAALRAAEARAQRLQERLDMVQEFADTGVFERDADTMEGGWDRHMYRIWGLPEPAPGEAAPPYAQVEEMVFPEDRRRDDFIATLDTPGPHAQRLCMRRPDGRVRHLYTQWQVFHDAQGRPRRVLGINTDDTEVYELANRAEQLRTELDVALKLGHIALWRHDLASDLVFVDEHGSHIIGIPFRPEGQLPSQARAHLHPEDMAAVLRSFDHTLRSGEPSDMELRYARPGGGWRHVLMRRALQRDAGGKPMGFVGVMLDVSERVEDSRRALDYARRLEAAAEAARVGLWSTRLDAARPSWNRRMFELLGLPADAGALPLRAWLRRCVYAADRAQVRAGIRAWRRRGRGEGELEFRIVRVSDGAVRWLVVRGRLDEAGDKAGEAPGLRAEGVAIDTTEQQQTLRQLRQTVERMTLASQALGLGTWTAIQGRDGGDWDAQMFRLRGVEAAAGHVSNEDIAAFLHPEDRAPVMAKQIAWLRDDQPWHHVFRVVWPDGQARWITSHSVPLHDEQGRHEGRIGVNWDSTEVHLSALAVREREVAVAESQAKSQAMSRISHELRTPLNAMLGFTQLLRATGDSADRATRAEWLAHVEDAGVHLLALIDDVLELSRAEVGELRMDRQAVACAEIADAALPLVAAAAQERAITLRLGPLAGRVLADPVRLRQVLINLLSNAIKYNRRGGEVRLWSEAADNRISLHVADTGIGIAPERLRHAFEPFNRLGAEASGVEGSGIGLSIVKVLVEHMGGRVEARSALGQGSEFIVHLDAASTAAPSASFTARTPAAPPACAAAPQARVLYIEDNPVNALLVREMLAHRPAVLLEVAVDGNSGLASARRLRPDLMLVDMQLPDIDGHAVLRALCADPLTAGIRCVALSANATPGDITFALAAGFIDYWTKPIEFQRFLAGIDALLAPHD
ncbi:putative Histidine kinase [Rubrivivax sp. A210]|uniref:hybrid sensor histidine kinase/response regulator n=1 Tax=Rubrivivax sp. A210 TaxID=2772301 RepID=UPI0019185D8A|nr:PAS domain-containing hybrid sensor histidine kinase/response regulator [Rubrivivax sp. A210]CAD5373441.1 putative Histidine kinase [Rubrivivax sp. A210]